MRGSKTLSILLYVIYGFQCLDNFNMGLHSTLLNTLAKLMNGFCVFVEAFGTSVYISKLIFSILCFVPMLCSLVLVVNVMNFFKYITLVPLLDSISLMQLPCVVVSVEC